MNSNNLLEILEASGNKLSKIDLSFNKQLQILDLSENSLSEISLDNLICLTDLQV